jgi:hypothetical protein
MSMSAAPQRPGFEGGNMGKQPSKAGGVICAVMLAAGVVFAPAGARAQGLVEEALKSFPATTLRIEYSNISTLRELPNYDQLHQRYLGPRLRDLEASLGKLGIAESDINEMVMGWENQSQWEFYGLVSGNFDPSNIASQAAAQGITARPVNGKQVFCFASDQSQTCAAALDSSLGVFGTFGSVKKVLTTRAGGTASLEKQASFTKLVQDEEGQDAPIWGVAVGQAVPDWFKSWMPNQGNLKLDWQQAFNSVETLTYSVKPEDQVDLEVRLNCTDSKAASSLGQILQGVKMFQQISWQQQNPNRPNPFQNLQVETDDRQIKLSLTADYQSLESGTLGHR